MGTGPVGASSGSSGSVGLCQRGIMGISSDQHITLPETEPPADITIETEPETIRIEPETEATEPETEPEERVEVDGMIRSYLTGEMVPVGQGNRRPLAIMMSNDKEALPQYGINRAGVVYEAQVEGTMNRYMAIIEDYDDLDRIGSVRSCRTYYTYFAREFDAIYAHFGQSTFAKPYLKNVDNINGIEGLGGNAFFRSSDRKRPHNAYASFEKLQKAMEACPYTLSLHDALPIYGHITCLPGKTGRWSWRGKGS